MGTFGERHGPGETFIRSFISLDADAKANAAIHLAFEHIENTYCTPSWWGELSEETQSTLCRRAMTGLGFTGPDRTAASMANLQPRLSDVRVLSDAMLVR
jgi:hypothetical protein